MAASRGTLRAEGLLSARAAFYVCYPGTAQADRIVTVPEREHAIGVTLLELCRKLRDLGRPELQAECIRARAALRDGASLEDLLEGARARGLLRDEASLAPRGGIACQPPALSPHRDAPALAGAADVLPVSSPYLPDTDCAGALAPPLPPPASPPAQCILAQVISTGRELIAQWTPRRSPSGSTEGSPWEPRGVKLEPANDGPAAHAIGETVPQVACAVKVEHAREPVKEEELRSCSLRAIARDLRRTGRSIGLLPFLVYAARRRARIHVLFGRTSVDIVDAFAPSLASICLDRDPPLTVVYCRCVIFWEGPTQHRVVRALVSDRDIVHGNHWVIAVKAAGGDESGESVLPHRPCRGHRCGRPGGSCMSPLQEHVRPLRYILVPTVEQGDCGLDAMAFWDGSERVDKTWKALRLELAAALESSAYDYVWQSALAACGEVSPGVAIASSRSSAREPAADAREHAVGLVPRLGDGDGCLDTAVRYFCGLQAGREDTSVSCLAERLAPAERAALVEAHSCAVTDCASIVPASATQDVRLRHSRRSLPALRRTQALSFLLWCRNSEINVLARPLPYGALTRYLATRRGVTRTDAVWLVRYARALAKGELTMHVPLERQVGCKRKRAKGGGRPCKVPALRHELFEWFLAVRGSTAARLTLGQLLGQARLLRRKMMERAIRNGCKVQFPVVDHRWVLRWRKEYQVSLRLPNRRWKVTRRVLLERLQITWLNIFRVRKLCWLCFGYDPEIEGFDQKPMHFNESGSRMRHTLAWKGCLDVQLKECVSQTRERWTLNTHVLASPRADDEFPPLEALFKGGPRVAASARAALARLRDEGEYGPLTWMSVAVGPRGSYRQEHVQQYLQRHLPMKTPGRAWRILLCDVYSAHKDDTIAVAAANRGYVLVFHGGGCTGVLQCNDTHLHQRLSARYQELEMADLLEQSRLRPHACPRRDREDCLRDAVAAWRDAAMHARAAAGHFENLLSVKLDGSEDHLGRGDALRFWLELDMPRKRQEAVAKVEEQWAAGELTWENRALLVDPFPARGQLDEYMEGQEDEGALVDGCPWSDREEPSSDEDDSARSASVGVMRSGLSAEQAVAVGEVCERVRQVDDMLDIARGLGNAHVGATLERARNTLLRQKAGEKALDPAVIAAAREVRQQHEIELHRSRARCTAARLAARCIATAARPSKLASAKNDMLRRERRAYRLRLEAAKAPAVHSFPARKGYDAEDLGQGKQHGGGVLHRKNRRDLMMRVAAGFPALAGEAATEWARNWRLWDAIMCRRHGRAVGHVVRNLMKEVLEAGAKGDTEAFRRLTRRVARAVPKPEIVA